MLKNTNELHTVLRRCPGNCARVLPHRKSFPAHPVPLRLKANTRRRADTDPRACAIQPRAGSSLFRRKVAGWRSTSLSNSRCHSFVWHNMYVYIIEREIQGWTWVILPWTQPNSRCLLILETGCGCKSSTLLYSILANVSSKTKMHVESCRIWV